MRPDKSVLPAGAASTPVTATLTRSGITALGIDSRGAEAALIRICAVYLAAEYCFRDEVPVHG